MHDEVVDEAVDGAAAERIAQIFQDALSLVYSRDVLVFSIACGFFAVSVCLLDLVWTRLSQRPSLLGVGFGTVRRNLQSVLLWGCGAVLAAYLGGYLELFNINSRTAPALVGVGWPTILPRLLAMAAQSNLEEEQGDEEVLS